MFGLYYYFKGRLLEGHVHTAHATRLAVALGLHKLDSRIFRPEPGSTPKQPFEIRRWHPRDPVELGEAINLWWLVIRGSKVTSSTHSFTGAAMIPKWRVPRLMDYHLVSLWKTMSRRSGLVCSPNLNP